MQRPSTTHVDMIGRVGRSLDGLLAAACLLATMCLARYCCQQACIHAGILPMSCLRSCLRSCWRPTLRASRPADGRCSSSSAAMDDVGAGVCMCVCLPRASCVAAQPDEGSQGPSETWAQTSAAAAMDGIPVPTQWTWLSLLASPRPYEEFSPRDFS